MADEELMSGTDTEGLQTTAGDDRGIEGTTVSAADQPTAEPSGIEAVTEDAGTWQSIREAATQRGFQFAPTVTDDRSALDYLIQQAGEAKRIAEAQRQADVYTQLGRQLAPKAELIQNFLRQQQAPTQQPTWKAPEFDQRWAALLERDPGTGLIVGKAGANVPSQVVDQANAHYQWLENFNKDPAGTLTGLIEERAQEIARKTFSEQFEAQQREYSIQSILSANAEWMYQRDPQGQPLKDYQGNYMPTPVGSAYIENLKYVTQAGVTDPRQQDALAQQLTRGAVALAQMQQSQARAAQAASPQTRQAVGRAPRNPLQALPHAERQATPGAYESEFDTGTPLIEQLRRVFRENGITDADIAASATSAA